MKINPNEYRNTSTYREVVAKREERIRIYREVENEEKRGSRIDYRA